MNNNDALRRIRFALDISDEQMVELFKLGGHTVTVEQTLALMEHEKEETAEFCTDDVFRKFLNGLIVDRRGPPPAGRSEILISTQLTNNIVMKKLRIALNMHEDVMLNTLEVGGHPMSRGELTALFRKPGHKHYRECGDQLFRKFLNGLTQRLRFGNGPNSKQS